MTTGTRYIDLLSTTLIAFILATPQLGGAQLVSAGPASVGLTVVVRVERGV